MTTLCRVLAVLCILYTIQLTMVQCDQALGNRIATMDLTTTAHRDRILSGVRGAGAQNYAASFQIWVKGISTSNFDIVKAAISAAQCKLISSNIKNQQRGLPHFGYVVARINCGNQANWQTLSYNPNFYTRVAFTERSYFTDNIPTTHVIPGHVACRMSPIPPSRIAVWQGKVNQHTLPSGQWSTDADGVSGADLNKLTYCKKFYPQTTGIRDYTTETISGWRDRGNTGGPYTRAVMTTECIQPVNNNCNYKRYDPIETPFPSEQVIKEVRDMLSEYEMKKESYFPADFKEMSVEDLLDFEQRRPMCLEPALQREVKLTGNETEVELKRISRVVCPPNPPPPPPYYPPPYYPPPPSNCLEPALQRQELQKELDAAQTEEEREEIKRRPLLCPPPPGVPPPSIPPPYVPPPPTLPPYIDGFEQTYNNQPNSNTAWGQQNGRKWTNYMENMGWTPTVDYYNQIFGGNFYLIDLGVHETHIDLLNVYSTPVTSRANRLPNVLAEPANQYAGFMDPDALAAIGQHPYLEQDTCHGTINAAILVGNELGLSRNIPLYHAKIGNQEYGVDMQAFQNALASVNELVASGAHSRPSVVVTPINFLWSYLHCYQLKVSAVPEEAPCSMGVMDELATAYDQGIIISIPSQNGQNHYDMLINPLTGEPFTNTQYGIHLCDTEPISAVPLDICNTASRQHNPEFNVWDMYLPVHEKAAKKPFIVGAHNRENRMARWRNIQYSLSDPEWENPWWQIGSSNYGSCVDFSSFGIDFSRSAAILSVMEDGHFFQSEYREKPYYISGTSYSTATAGSVAVMKAGLYTPSYFGLSGYNGQFVEAIRNKMKQEARYIIDDYDICRVNYWQNGYDLRSFPRLKYF